MTYKTIKIPNYSKLYIEKDHVKDIEYLKKNIYMFKNHSAKLAADRFWNQ